MPHTLIYGGTFDPIHHGHLITCQKARELLNADRVLFIPAAVSPHKTARQPVASAGDRLNMLQLAIAGSPFFSADSRELGRTGPSYTADTLDELERAHPGDHFTLLLGADQLPKFHAWHRIKDILAVGGRRNVAILARPGSTLAALNDITQHLGQSVADRLAKSLLPTPLIDISSTDIRDRVRRGLPIDYLVPPPVAAYIQQNKLYK